MDQKLSSFVAHAKSKSMDLQSIRMLLLAAGWREKDIAAAVASQTLDLPVPIPVEPGSAKDAFLHLLAFATLYSTVINLIILSFQFIGRLFPDTTESVYEYSSATSQIRWSIAFLLVSFPLFVFVSRLVHRELLHVPEKMASGVRRWLTYLTLFVTTCTIVGDLVTVLFYLLDGELSVRFLAKAAAVLVLTSIPFYYYFSVLRMDYDQYRGSRLHSKSLFTSMSIVLAALVYGFFTVGTPGQGRLERFDTERLSDLRAIQNQIYEMAYGPERYANKRYTATPRPVPTNLSDVASASEYQKIRIQDPVTNVPYEYIISGAAFALCAHFSLPLDAEYDIFWNHPSGRHCFTFDSLDPRGK